MSKRFLPERIISMRQMARDGWSYADLSQHFATTRANVWHVVMGISHRDVGGPIRGRDYGTHLTPILENVRE